MKAPRIHVSGTTGRLLFFTLAIAISSFGGCNNVGDQYCPVGTLENDKDDQCPYGVPGGPGSRDKPTGCVAFNKNDPAPNPATCISWGDLWDKTLNVTGAVGGACALNNVCHAGGTNPVMTGDAANAFDVLTKFEGSVGTPYINPQNPSASWMLCNLRYEASTLPKVGNLMPSSPTNKDVFDKVQLWLKCGAKNDGAASTGTAGTAGTTGAGGAG